MVVNLLPTIFILISLALGKPLKTLYGDTLCRLLCGCLNFLAIKQVLGGFFIAVYRIICVKMPRVAFNPHSHRKITNQLLLLELITAVFFLEMFYFGGKFTYAGVTLVFLR